MTIQSISTDLLVSWTNAKQAAATARLTSSATASQASGTATAPWADSSTQTSASDLVKSALSSTNLFNTDAQTTASGGSADYKKLFTLWSGLNSLAALAGALSNASLGSSQRAQLQNAFASGAGQLDSFLDDQTFDSLNLIRGQSVTSADSAATIKTTSLTYTTGVVATGDADTANAAFGGNIAFNIHIDRDSGGPLDVAVNLADMGSTPRSLNNVVSFINQRLAAAGAQTRVASNQIAKATTSVAGAAVPAQWGIQVNTVSGESLSFAAATTTPAIYLAGMMGTSATTAGATTVTQNTVNLLKVQDPAGAGAQALSGAPNVAFNQVLAQATDIAAVRSVTTDAQGNFYVLADISDATDGQQVKGGQDVALIKFDSTGTRLFTRALGASQTAQGLSLAVGPDGQVAVAGKVQGALVGADSSTDNSWDSFVTLYDAQGVEQWINRSRATGDDAAVSVAIADNGQVYVAGSTTNALPGQTSAGGQDGYVRGFNADGSVRFTQEFGTAGADAPGALAVETVAGGVRLTVGGVEQGHGVLRQFTDTGSATPTVGAVRDIGSLAGGAISQISIAGGALYVGGETKAGGLSAGTVAQAYSGGQDGFVAKLSTDITAAGGDRISYVGSTGTDNLAGFSVVGGNVYVAGDATGALGGAAPYGVQDGFVARLDSTGALAWSQHIAAPSGGVFTAGAMGVDATGASALDRLGLPTGALGLATSGTLVARTALRSGDSFSFSINGGPPQTITVTADDTLTTFANRLNTLLMNHGTATVSTDGDSQNLHLATKTSDRIELIAGPEGHDALAGFGLPEGEVAASATTSKTTTTTSSSGATLTKNVTPTFGLGLPATFDVSTAAGVAQAVQALGAAMSTVQSAYRTLSAPAAAPDPGTVPAYLQAQIANYQAGLARLQASQTDSSDSPDLASLAAQYATLA
jgi:hypothetical protein